MLRVGQTDVEVGVQGFGDVGAKVFPHALARNPPDDLAHQVPEGDGVVAVPGPRFPPGLFFCQGRREGIPIVQNRRLQGLADRGQAGLVAEELADGNVLLAPCGEFVGALPRIPWLGRTFGTGPSEES